MRDVVIAKVHVNGVKWTVLGGDDPYTYDDIVGMAFPPDSLPKTQLTVQYSRGHADNPSGVLLPGESVKIKNGMIFDVADTSKA